MSAINRAQGLQFEVTAAMGRPAGGKCVSVLSQFVRAGETHAASTVSDYGVGEMTVRLTVKLAQVVDGIDLTHCDEGDVIELAPRDAQLLVAEGWAEPAGQTIPVTRHATAARESRAVAADNGYNHNAA